MPKTLLADLIDRQVQASVASTLSRTAERTAEELADELLRDPEFRARMKQLAAAAFERALASLTDETER